MRETFELSMDDIKKAIIFYLLYKSVIEIKPVYDISFNVSAIEDNTENQNTCYVSAIATEASGRSEETTAIVALVDRFGKALCGQKKADKMMAAETKT